VKKFFQALTQIWQELPPRTYFFIFAVAAVLVAIGLAQLSGDDDSSLCSPERFFGQCYDVPRALCETTLAVIQKSCESEVKKITKPGQLVGPIVDNCEQTRFDRILKYTRKSDSLCNERIHYLETWQKSNPDF
jgi:hypothetical protein